LARDPDEHRRHLKPDEIVLMGREEGHHAFDRLLRVDRVQRRNDEVAGFGRRDGRRHRLRVSDFADHDDIRGLAHRRAKPGGPRPRVQADFPLIHHGEFVGESEFDGVFERDDVRIARRVDALHERREPSCDLPDPVTPVTSTSPRSAAANDSKARRGSFKSSNPGTAGFT
jgi:hypothetical protein